MKKLVFRYQNVVPNAHFKLELMELVLNYAIMKFQEDFFMQILEIVMGTNLAPILTNIYMGLLDEEVNNICIKKNIKRPKMFKRFSDDGFGVIKSNKKEFLQWVNEFNNLRENIFQDKWQIGNKVALWTLKSLKGKTFIFSEN